MVGKGKQDVCTSVWIIINEIREKAIKMIPFLFRVRDERGTKSNLNHRFHSVGL